MNHTAFLQTGFRPFFLLAGLHAAGAVLVWYLTLSQGLRWPLLGLSPTLWHAHEMVYGYSMAVIAGFLLTAVRNWTGRATAHGGLLGAMALLWALARLLPMGLGVEAVWWVAALDLLFWALLSFNLLRAIAAAQQWKQMAVLSKLVLLGLGNALFYVGHALDDLMLMRLGLLGGLYLVLGLVLMLSRRLIPFFIERGVGEPVKLVNRAWLDRLSLILFVMFFGCALYPPARQFAAMFALALFVLHGLRILGWHTLAIWRKPMIWVLFLGYAFTIVGFGLYALSEYSTISVSLAYHAFAYGGIGMLTLGMMARVSLGHTGRDVYQPPRGLTVLFLALLAGALVRVFLPWLAPSGYVLWIELAQGLWALAFAGFALLYGRMLMQPRVDGKPG